MVSRTEVIQSYRSVLGRAPESEAAIEPLLHFPDRWVLAAALVGSEEYRASSRSRPEPGGTLSPDQMDQAVGAFLRGELERDLLAEAVEIRAVEDGDFLHGDRAHCWELTEEIKADCRSR